MLEYFINDDIIEAMASQIRRITNTTRLYNGAEIGELLYKIEGTIGEVDGAYCIQAVEHDGSVIKSSRLNSGMVFACPTDITLPDGYVFNQWQALITTPLDANYLIVENADATIYPSIDTSDGATEFVTSNINTITFDYLDITIGGTVTIDWGDGNTTIINNAEYDYAPVSHTYNAYGTYTIKMYCDDIYGVVCGDEAKNCIRAIKTSQKLGYGV